MPPFDLNKLDTRKSSETPATLHLRHPATSEPIVGDDSKPWTIDLLGSDSAPYKGLEHVQQARRIQKGFRQGRSALPTPQEVQADAIDLLVKVTVGWSGLILNGEPLAFTEANIRLLYTTYDWVREQASAFVSDRANYLGNS